MATDDHRRSTITQDTVEKARLLFESLSGGTSQSNGHGFNQEDSIILEPRTQALPETGTSDGRKDTLRRLEEHKNTQLKGAGSDYNAMVDAEKQKSEGSQPKNRANNGIDPDVIKKAWKILTHSDLVKERREYIGKSVYGGEHAIDTLTYVCHSAYLGRDYVIHADVIGDPEIGKSTSTDKSLATMPQEDIIVFAEMSPKYVYYKSENTDFTGKSIYIDDTRDEHVPTLKTLRNDTEGRQGHGTVISGEAVDLQIRGRPAVIASCVNPLRDAQGQAVSRALQVPIEKPPEGVEKNVRKTIRRKIGKGALKPPAEEDQEKLVLQQSSRILRDEGLKDIVIPFDAEEPKGSGRRATAQFGRLIIVSAYLHQYQRPILHIGDKKFVLAIHEDLENALRILVGLGVGNLLKIAPKSIALLKQLPSQEPNLNVGVKSEIVMTSQKLHDLTEIPERTINDHLADLYEAGLVSRKKVKAPGSPYAYWTDPKISAVVSVKDGEAS